MMRCVQCNRDYLGGERFCHQCGEPLRARNVTVESPVAPVGAPALVRRARTAPRRGRHPASTSLMFAILVLVGAGAGLALVWHQRWMPPMLRASARLVGEPAPRPADPAPEASPDESPAPETAAARTESLTETPPATPPAPPAPAPKPVEQAPAPPAPPAASTPPKKAADSAAASAPTPAARPLPETASPKALARADAPAPARPVAPSSDPATGARILSVRTDPATPSPGTGSRVVSLVPVGSAMGARGQLLWERQGGGVLVVSGLPQPPTGRTYQLWLGSITLGNRISGGLLAVDSQGAGTLRVAPPRAPWSADIFGVTLERQGGAREPSDDLVLVGELSKLGVSAPPPAAPPASASPAPAEVKAGSMTASIAESPPLPTAPVTPSTLRGADGEFVRIVPVPVDRTWTVTQSVLKSLGWDIDRVDQTAGVIRTEPRNVTFKDFVVYAEGMRHSLDIVVRPVTGSQTSISVKREVFEERRIFWNKERKVLPTPETTVEETLLDAIERVL